MDPIARENEFVGTMKRNGKKHEVSKDANQNETVSNGNQVDGTQTKKKNKNKR